MIAVYYHSVVSRKLLKKCYSQKQPPSPPPQQKHNKKTHKKPPKNPWTQLPVNIFNPFIHLFFLSGIQGTAKTTKPELRPSLKWKKKKKKRKKSFLTHVYHYCPASAGTHWPEAAERVEKVAAELTRSCEAGLGAWAVVALLPAGAAAADDVGALRVPPGVSGPLLSGAAAEKFWVMLVPVKHTIPSLFYFKLVSNSLIIFLTICKVLTALLFCLQF